MLFEKSFIINFILLSLTFILLFSSSVIAADNYSFSFESGRGDWSPRGAGVELKVVDSQAAAGSRSLYISGRTENWQGPSLNITGLVAEGKEYKFSLKVKLNKSADSNNVILSAENNKDGDKSWDNIASTEVSADSWTELTGNYVINSNLDDLILYVESPDTELEFYIDDIKISRAGKITENIENDITSLTEAYSDHFKIGAAVEPSQLEGEHAELLKKHFNSLTAENAMKVESIQPEKSKFDFSGADKILNFAETNNMIMRGHTLVWHSQTPDWFFKDENGELLSKEALLARMKKHIKKTMEHYKGDIKSWDVVNEALDPSAEQNDGLRNSKWYQIAGLDYIKEAFIYAHKIDPEAKLFINDYNLLSDPNKRDIMYNLVKKLLAADVPIDGIGMQGHINIESPSTAAVEKTLSKFSSLGVDLEITELDISVYTNDNQSYDNFSRELAVKQGHRYREIFNLFKQYSDHITNVTLWGIADDHTWLTSHPVPRNNWPLLFDKSLKAKPAFWGAVKPEKLEVISKEFDLSKGKAKIDGKSDKIWENTGDTLTLEENEFLSGDLKLSWDQNNIYLYGKIKDQSNNPSDSVEIFIDEKNLKADNSDIKHYKIRRDNSAAEEIEAEIKNNSDSYLVEAAIPIESEELEIGKKIAFDLKINDQKSGTSIIWNDFTKSQETKAENYGTLILNKAPVITRAVSGNPKIDAELDEAWSKANEIKTDIIISGDDPAGAVVKTMWDKNNLYIYAEVKDDLLSTAGEQVHEEDSVEIFVDENNDKSSEYQKDDTQYRVNYLNEQSFNPERDGFKTATRETDYGYIVEAKVPFITIEAEEEKIIGFDFQVNDDASGDGSRDGVSIWNDKSGEGWRNMSGLGNLLFVK